MVLSSYSGTCIVVTTNWLEQRGRQFIGLHYCMLLFATVHVLYRGSLLSWKKYCEFVDSGTGCDQSPKSLSSLHA